MSVSYATAEDLIPSHGLAREAYTAEETFRDEMDRIWTQGWVYVAHASQVADAGDFLTRSIGPHRLIVVRGEDGQVRALHNVCRHRGSIICREETGHRSRAFRCPFHGWAYGLDGRLLGAPKMPNELIDEAQLGLKQALVEDWNGFLFVALGADRPEPLAAALEGADFERYDLERTRVAAVERWTLDANWKTVWEGGVECYHCAINHPELIRLLNMDEYSSDQRAGPSPDFEFTPAWALREGMSSLTMSGEPACRLPLGPQAQEPSDDVAFLQRHIPPWEVAAGRDFAITQPIFPISAQQTLLEMVILVHADAVEGQDYELETLIELTRVTREQDNDLAESVQAGINQPAFEPGPFNPTFELLNQRFAAKYLEAMGQDSVGVGASA